MHTSAHRHYHGKAIWIVIDLSSIRKETCSFHQIGDATMDCWAINHAATDSSEAGQYYWIIDKWNIQQHGATQQKIGWKLTKLVSSRTTDS